MKRIRNQAMPDGVNYSDLVGLALSQYMADSAPDPDGLKPLAMRMQVVPVYSGWWRCLAIRSDGRVISFDVCSLTGATPPGEIRVENHPAVRNLAFDEASRRFSAFRTLAPNRSSGDVECPDCDGTGRLPLPPPTQFKCFSCGGVGWLPPNSSKGTNDWAFGRQT